MTREDALREENALCDIEQKHSFSLGRPAIDAKRVAEAATSAPSSERSVIINGMVITVGSGPVFQGSEITSWGALVQGAGVFSGGGVNTAGKTEDRRLAG